MIFSVSISRQAEVDLRGIFEYIACELQSMESAVGQLNRLEEMIFGLDHMPDRFRSYSKEPWRGRGLRVMPVDNYLVLYIPDVTDQTVNIVRVMYGGRDVNAELDRFTGG